MGQASSSTSSKNSGLPSITISILHQFSPFPPKGFLRNGSIHFSVSPDETVEELLTQINEYRSPSSALTSLLNDRGEPYPPSTELRTSRVYYV
jgi:hypothetical protein